MALVDSCYEHFEEWWKTQSDKDHYSKGTPSCKDGKPHVKCIGCSFEIAISPNGKFWNISNFKRHLRDPEKCHQKKLGTIQMDSGDSLTHLDDDRDSDSEEMQVSSIDLLLETSENSTETQVEEACSLHEKDGIYVDVNADNLTAFITCHYCPRLKMLLRGFRNNVEYNVRQHIDSIDHQQNCKQKRITQFGTSTKRKSLQDFTNPSMAAQCLGYRPSTKDESYHQEMQLLREFDLSRDLGFFPDRSIRHLYLKSDSTVSFVSTFGSFRSDRCIFVTKSLEYPLAAHICLHCMIIPRSRQYQSLLEIVTEGPNKKRPIKCELVGNLRLRYREQNECHKKMRLQLFNAAKWKARQQRPNILKVLKLDVENGDLQSLIKNLILAYRLKKIPVNDYSFANFKDTAQNWLRTSRGYRYSPIVKNFMYGVAAFGGERTAKFVAVNNENGSVSSRYRHSKKEEVAFTLGIQENNMKIVGEIIKNIKDELGISQPLTFAFGQDETPVVKCITVHCENKQLYLLGFCGLEPQNGEGHVCFGSQKFIINSLADIFDAFEKGRIANSISLVMLSIFHNSFESYPLFISPTCGCFTQEDMRNQWQTFHAYSDAHFKPILHTPLCGVGSDGCTTRSPMQFRKMAINDANGNYLGAHADGSSDFTLTDSCIGLRGRFDEACAYNIHFQDYYHCIKKDLLSTDIVSRTLVFGNQYVMLSMIRAKVLAKYPGNMEDWSFEHKLEAKLSKADIDYKDRMNVKIAQKYCSLDIQDLLLGDHSCVALRLYLQCIFRFRMMFVAVYITVTERIKYCGFCLGFLWSWYHHVRENSELTLSTNFITTQAFRDSIISLNAWILLLMSERNNKPDGNTNDFCPHKSGSNMCEIFFSLLSGFGNIEAGKRDCNVAEVCRIATKRLTVLKFKNEGLKDVNRRREHDPDRRHLKEDEINLGFDDSIDPEPLSLFTDDYIREHLKIGYDEAIAGVKSFEGTSTLIDENWSVVCDPKYIAYSNMATGEIQQQQQQQQQGPAENQDDNDGDDHDDDDEDRGMDLDEHRSAAAIVHAQRSLTPSHTVMIDVDPNETFQASEEDENEAIAAAIVAISDLDDALDAATNEENDHTNIDNEKPSVWHVSNGSGGWVDTRKVVALLNQNSGANKLSKDRAQKIIQSFSATGKKNGTAAYGAVIELEDVVQSIGLNSIAAFCFEDASVKGGLRFWLGKILRMVHRPKTGSKKLLTSRIALKDIPGDLYLSCTWYTPILHNSDTVLTARHYELLPQQVSDLTTQVDAKYIVSVVELQQEDNHYCLSNDHLSVISSYIKETASAFAPDVPTSQSGSEKVPATKTKNCTSISSSALGSDTRAYSTTSSSRATKKSRSSYG